MKRLGLALALWASLSLAAVAQVGGLSFPGPGGPHTSGGGGSLTLMVPGSPNAAVASGTPSLPTNFGATAFNIGTASADRIVVLGVQWSAAAPLTPNADILCASGNVTGNSGAITFNNAAHYFNTSTERGHNVCWALVPTGTTMTISVTTAGGSGFLNDVLVEVLTIKGSAAATVASSITTSPPGHSSGPPAAGSVTVPSGGVAVLSAIGNPSTSTFTWTGTTSSSSDIDNVDTPGSILGSVAHATASASVSLAYTGGGQGGWAGAVFQP